MKKWQGLLVMGLLPLCGGLCGCMPLAGWAIVGEGLSYVASINNLGAKYLTLEEAAPRCPATPSSLASEWGIKS